MNIVLITVDCLRADFTGFCGGKSSVTPHTDLAAHDAITFRRAIVAGTPTFFSFPSIFASRPCLKYGRDFIGLMEDEPTLTSILNANGYRTSAFIAGNTFLGRNYGYDSGFDDFNDYLTKDNLSGSADDTQELNPILKSAKNLFKKIADPFPPIKRWYDDRSFNYNLRKIIAQSGGNVDNCRPYPDAEQITDNAMEWLTKNNDSKFFMWLHYMDAHHPYYPPIEILRERDRQDLTLEKQIFLNRFWNRGDDFPLQRYELIRDDVAALYEAGIAWIDRQIGRFISELQSLEVWDNTLFVFTSDHGEEFLEHGGRFHAPTNLSDEIVNVPLMMKLPKDLHCKGKFDSFSLMDLTPTILDIAGVCADPAFDGESSWSKLNTGSYSGGIHITEAVYNCSDPTNRELRLGSRIMCAEDGSYKLVLNFSDGSMNLFDISTDPAELNPVSIKDNTSTVKKLVSEMVSHVENSIENQNADNILKTRLETIKRDLQ